MRIASTTYLTRRGHVYFFRMNIPLSLRKDFQQTEIMLSLKTADFALARFRCRMAANWLERLFLHMSHGGSSLSPARLEQLVQEYFRQLRRTYITQTVFTPEQGRDERLEIIQDMEIDLAHRQEHHLAYPLSRREIHEVEQVFQGSGLTVPAVNHPDFAYVGEGVRAASVEAERLLINKLRMAPQSQQVPEGRFADKPVMNIGKPTMPVAKTLSDFIDEYEELKTGPSDWNAKSALAGVASLRLFLRFMREDRKREHILLEDIQPSDLMRYRQLIQGLPANLSKKTFYAGMTLAETVANRRPKDKAFDAGYAGTQLTRVKTFLSYAHDLGHIATNPAASQFLTIRAPKKTGKSRARRGFTPDELKQFFGSAAYNSEQLFKNGGEWWLPMLALYTGARQAELVWLKVADLREADGVTYLSIEASEERNLKTEPSFRDVPVHPMLVKLGFLDYVKRYKREKQTYLFPDVCLRETKRTPQDAYSKRFATLMKNAGLPDPKLVFHSFRHTLVTAARSAGISKDVRVNITGHVKDEDDDVHDRYGDFEMKLKAENMAKIDYGIDWDAVLKPQTARKRNLPPVRVASPYRKGFKRGR